ncbi:MAG: SGNH/GDSL hydrolase family protein, partial [Pseudomonadota bacterium]
PGEEIMIAYWRIGPRLVILAQGADGTWRRLFVRDAETGRAGARLANLPEGGMIGPDGTLVRTKQVPVPSFDGNEAYSVAKGLQIHYLHTDNRDPGDRELGLTVPQAYEAQLQSTFSNLTVWHPRLSGIDAPYSSRLTFEGIDLLGSGDPESTGFLLDHFANQRNFTVTDTTIEGFGTGFAVPRQGQSVIEGLESANLTDLVIGAPHGDPRDLEIRDVDFRPLGGPLAGQEESREPVVLDRFRDMDFDAGQDDGFFDLDPAEQAEVTVGEASARKRLEVEIDPLGDPVYSPFFLPDRVVLEERGGEAVGLYFDAALPDAIPVAPGSELDAYLPEGVAGATNAELQARFGFSFADALPPGDAVPVEGVIGGVAGTPLPPFEGFPPPIDPRLRIDDGGAGVGDDDDDDEEADDDAPVSIAFIGDSITDTGGEGFVEILQADVGEEAALMNFALGGSGLTDHALRWQDTEEADDFAESAPDIVWIMIGGNDIDPGNNGGASVEEYAAELDALVDDISAMESDPTVVIAAQPPFHAVDGIGEAVHETFREEWVPAMEQIAEDHDAAFVDVNAMVDDYPENYPDQIHPDEAGAETLAAIIGDALYEIVEQRADEAPEEDDEDEDDEAGFEGFFERVLERFGRDGEMPLRGRLEREEADGGEVGQFGGRAMRLRDRERDDEVAVTADTFRFFGGEADDALGDLGLTIDGDVPTLPAPRFLLAETLEPVEDGFCLDHFDF